MGKAAKRKAGGKGTADNALVAQSSNGGVRSMLNWLLLLIAVLPHLISTQAMDPALVIRYIFLGSFIALFLLFFYGFRQRIAIPDLPILTKWVFGLGVVYCLWSIVSMFFALNPQAAYYEVSRNWLNLLFLIIAFLALQREEERIGGIFRLITLVAIVQSLVGILQNFDIAFTEIPGNFKPYGLMANRNLFGSAQVFVLPFVIYTIYRDSKLWKALGVLAFLGLITSIVLSQTRSAWLGAVVVLILTALLVALFVPAQRKRWLLSLLVIVVVISAALGAALSVKPEGALAKAITKRVQSFTNPTESKNVKERIKIWEKSVEVIKDNPVIGVGPSNWKLAVPAYGTEGLWWETAEFVPDRPHNIYLSVAGKTGIPGALLYFGMWVLILYIGIVAIRRSEAEDKRVMLILMWVGLIAFLLDGMVSFPLERIEHMMYVLLMAAILLVAFSNTSAVEGEQTVNGKLLYLILIIPLFNIFIGYERFQFEWHQNRAIAYERAKRYQQVVKEVEQGKSYFIPVDDIGKPLQLYSTIAYKEMKNYPKALEEANIALKYSPNNSKIYNNIGTIYTDMRKFDKAIENYEKALELTPKFEIALKNLAVNYYTVGRYADCVAALDQLKEIEDKVLIDIYADAKARL